jgi:hypothetical protein
LKYRIKREDVNSCGRPCDVDKMLPKENVSRQACPELSRGDAKHAKQDIDLFLETFASLRESPVFLKRRKRRVNDAHLQ